MQTLSANERYNRMDLNRQKALDTKLSMPLEAKTDALKLKELTKRFPFADFHVTDIKMDLYYKVSYNHSSVDWMPEMLWYKNHTSWFEEEDYGSPFYYFPRPCKITITLHNGDKKDITYFFD
jgi:hypothetical protein